MTFLSSISSVFDGRTICKDIVADRFRKSFKSAAKVNALDHAVTSLFSGVLSNVERTKAISILEDVKVWAWHYLVRDAKIPIFNHSGPLHLPFHEYLSKNEDTYYRGDGGSIIKIFKAYFREQFPKLRGHSIGLVNPEKCVGLFNSCCIDSEMKYYGGGYSYRKMGSLSAIVPTEPRTLFDISELLQACYFSGKQDFNKLMDEIQMLVDKLPPETVVSGVVTVSDGVGVFIRFEPSQGRGSVVDEQVRYGLFGLIKNYSGLIGAIPEMLLVKKGLVHLGFEMNQLLPNNSIPSIKLSSTTHDPAPDEFEEKLSRLSLAFERLLKNDKAAKCELAHFYLSLMYRFLREIQSADFQKVGNEHCDSIFASSMLHSIDSITKRLLKIEDLLDHLSNQNAPEQFSALLQHLYLTYEEISFLSVFCTPRCCGEGLKSVLEKTFPLSLPLSGLNISKSFFPFNSCMSCHENILSAHISMQNRCSETKELSMPHVVFMNGSYSELTGDPGLKDYFEKSCHSSILSPSQMLSSIEPMGCDVLFMDLHPNCVHLKEVRTNPVVDLVRNALSRRPEKSGPMTVVLDTTTHLFSDPKVEAILEQLKEEIATGRVNFVISTSLAKFYNFGLDKHSGGTLIFYGGAKHPFSQLLHDELENKYRNNPFSKESQNFYSLLFSTSKNQIDSYYQAILLNTQKLYQSLQVDLQKEDSCLHLGRKDPDILMLGLHFDFFLKQVFKGHEIDPVDFDKVQKRFVQLYKLYLYKKCIVSQLPVHIRRSFSFPNSSLTDYGTALRMTVGLENEPILNQYATTFKAADNELKKYLAGNDQKMIRQILLNNEEQFELILSQATRLINDNKDVSFEGLIASLAQNKQ